MENMNNHLYGTDLFGREVQEDRHCKLADDFIVPPFSVLSARDGAWQDRKRRWLSFGIKSELGRGDNALNLLQQAEDYRQGNGSYAKHGNDPSLARCFGQDLMRGEHTVGAKSDSRSYKTQDWVIEKGLSGSCQNQTGTSIFDPVLCELAYRWFAPPQGQIVDPFSGGSVRGIVASILGYKYWGCDLRSEQIAANREQAEEICESAPPVWTCGDSMETLESAPEADFVFSCPPYGDLERYSDDQRDISTMDYHAFMGAYRRIILRACLRLKPNRFACFVVGDFRDPRSGHYRNFVADTIESFRQCGLGLYNEAILVTAVGSLPIRVGKQFKTGRKLGKTHQNILVFVKGDWREAAAACGDLTRGYEML
jgi:DNA modification methylase